MPMRLAPMVNIFSATIAVLPILLHAPARAADVSAWNGDANSAARLVAAASRTDGNATIYRAGVEIRLAPGWKTYWRYPGDAGVPPRFDFAESDNVRSVKILWPAPQKITDPEGTTIGYKSDVLFPVHVEPKQAGKPVELRIALDYAICERLCIPVQAKASLRIDGTATELDAAVAAAERIVPRPQPLGAPQDLSIRRAARDPAAQPERILIDVAVPAGQPASLFAEGPSPDWALPIPEPVAGAPEPNMQRFALVLDGLPSGTSSKGAVILLTAVSGSQSVETPIRLD